MSSNRTVPKVGSLFWEDGDKSSQETLQKPIVKLSMMIVGDKKLATISSRFGEADQAEIIKLQRAAGKLVDDLKVVLENVSGVGSCTSYGAYKLGKLINEFINKNRKHVIVNFTSFLAKETRDGVFDHRNKFEIADTSRLAIFQKCFTKKNCIDYPDLWKTVRLKLMMLEKAGNVKAFLKWYKGNYTINFSQCNKKLVRMTK
jgi:hypothetical protein